MWARKISLPKVSVCNFILRLLCLRTDLLRICALSYLFLPTFALAALSLFSAFPPFQRADIFHFAAATSSQMEFQPVHLEIKMRRMGMMLVAAMRKMRRKIVMRVLS